MADSTGKPAVNSVIEPKFQLRGSPQHPESPSFPSDADLSASPRPLASCPIGGGCRRLGLSARGADLGKHRQAHVLVINFIFGTIGGVMQGVTYGRLREIKDGVSTADLAKVFE